MFGDFELEPYPSGLHFPAADEAAWTAFQASLARLRRPEPPARIIPRKPAAPPPPHSESLFLGGTLSRIAAPASPG